MVKPSVPELRMYNICKLVRAYGNGSSPRRLESRVGLVGRVDSRPDPNVFTVYCVVVRMRGCLCSLSDGDHGSYRAVAGNS